MNRLSAWFLGAAFLTTSSFAAIEFDSKVVEIHAEPGAQKVKATFQYSNTGTVRERIYRIDTNCGCLSAEVDRRVLAPGDSGTLEAIFNVKGKSGGIGKTLTVVTGFGFRPSSIKLDVRVFIPKLIRIEPESVVWKRGDEPTPKTIRVEMNHDKPIRILKMDTSRRSVGARLTTIEEGKSYEIEITPDSTSTSMLGVVRLETDCDIPEQRRQMAFFRVEK